MSEKAGPKTREVARSRGMVRKQLYDQYWDIVVAFTNQRFRKHQKLKWAEMHNNLTMITCEADCSLVKISHCQ